MQQMAHSSILSMSKAIASFFSTFMANTLRYRKTANKLLRCVGGGEYADTGIGIPDICQ